MNKRATYCQKVHYTYISQKNSHLKKIKLRCDLYEMHHPHVRYLLQENYYITAENAGADPVGELPKTRNCRSISHGLYE